MNACVCVYLIAMILYAVAVAVVARSFIGTIKINPMELKKERNFATPIDHYHSLFIRERVNLSHISLPYI